MSYDSKFVISSRHLGEFADYVAACRHWAQVDPTLAGQPDIRYFLSNFPDAEIRGDGFFEAQVIYDSPNGKTVASSNGDEPTAERALFESGLFNATLSSIGDFIYVLDREGRFLYANKALLDLWGLPLSQAVGKNFFDLQYPSELAAKLQSQVRTVVETGHGLSDETSYTSPSGASGYYEYIFRPVLSPAGTVEAVAGSTRNITERRRRELNYSLIAEMQKVLAPLSTVEDILHSIGALLSGHLQLSHCLFVEIDEAADEATILYDHCADSACAISGTYRIRNFHTEEEREKMADGGTLLINDVRELRSSENAARFLELGIGSLANAGFFLDNRWKFVLSAQKRDACEWPAVDAELISQVAVTLYLRLERARAEEKLRHSEAQFRETFENAGIGIAHVGLDGRWLRTNQIMCEILGYPAGELGKLTYADITHPDDLPTDLALVDRVLRGEIPTFSMEKRYIRKDGTTVWANLTVSLLRDRSGKPLHFISAVEDITEKRAAIEALESQQRFVERLTHVMPSVLYVFDLAEQRTVWVNRQVAVSIGYSEEEVVKMGGDVLPHIMHPEDLAAMPGHFEKLAGIADGETVEMEYRFRHRNGEWRWFRSCDTAFRRDPDGRVIEIIGTATDVTERHLIEAALKEAKETAERANRSKDNFLAVLSHELRTPLTPILMAAADLRVDDRLPDDAREELGMIERNVALEARLIDDLLDHSKIVNGKLTMLTQLCDAHRLIGLVIEMVRQDADEKEIQIQSDLAATRTVLKGDPARLQQVFWNLLRNAVKFSRKGGIVRVRTLDGLHGAEEEGEEVSTVCIEVVDEGVGFEPGVVELIFQPFEQAQSGQRFGGLGLGLAIARGIVEIHGGRIRARSPGTDQGATFTIELPGARKGGADYSSSRAGEEHAGFGNGTATPAMRILLVEDHEPTMQILSKLLVRAGHRVISTTNIETARQAAAESVFDLVISDLGLPDGSGIDLMRSLRDSYGLRGIALSGYGTEKDLHQSHDAGFVEHLVKPVDFKDLQRVLLKVAGVQ